MTVRFLIALGCTGFFGLVSCIGLAACVNSQSTEITGVQTGPLMLTDDNGVVHDIGAIRRQGKSVALVFWQTWCIACRQEAPALVVAAKTQADTRFFGVVSGSDAIVDAEELRSVTEELGLPFPQTRDKDGSVAERFGVVSTPTIILLDPEGRVQYRGSSVPDAWRQPK